MTNKEIIETIVKSAKDYKNRLEGQTILFIYNDKSEKKKFKQVKFIETIYFITNFLHLTGIKTKDTAADFYRKAISQKLTANDLQLNNLTEKERFNVERKLEKLKKLMEIEQLAKMIGSYDDTIKNKLYTEILIGNISCCLGYVKHRDSKYYVPNTALDEDIRDITYTNNNILAIMKKYKKEKRYSKITYLGKNIDLKQKFTSKELESLIDFKNLYFYNKANLKNTEIVENLKKSYKYKSE